MAISDILSGGIASAAAAGLSALGMPCTFNGVPIQLYGCTVTKAPQVKVHLGAFWTYPRVESLGTAPTRIRVNGFLDPSFAIIERPILELMITLPVAGLLTIPSGIIYARCMSADFIEDISNIVEVNLEFMEVNSLLGAIDDLLGTNIGGSINSAVSNVTSSVGTALSGAVSSAKSAIGGLF
jgi:hypothetical protein